MCFRTARRRVRHVFRRKTLATLFCTLAVVAAYKNIRFFEWAAKRIVSAFGTLRRVVFALVLITYVGSMILANDMALITFLPLGYVALDSCGRRDKLPIVFVMQNVAANLGGMLTPFGNPQNLYLYSFYGLQMAEFMRVMAVPFAVALALILGVCAFVKGDAVSLVCHGTKRLARGVPPCMPRCSCCRCLLCSTCCRGTCAPPSS